MFDYLIRAEQPFNMMETHNFSGQFKELLLVLNIKVGQEILLKEIL